jgi:hypothetical protein
VKDAVATMGTILPDDAGGRDAVHVAVFSAVSDERLRPGQHIGVVHQDGPDTQVSAKRLPVEGTVAIVDPFLEGSVQPGQRFWAYLYPRTITALSHRWSHPAFGDAATVYVTPATRLEAEQWVRNWCDSHDAPDYDDLITVVNAIADGQTRGTLGAADDDYYGWWLEDEYLGFSGQDAHSMIPDELWDKLTVVVGRQIFHNQSRPSYFTCSC